MNLKIIKSEKDYQKALTRLDEIFHAKPKSIEADELQILTLLIEKYENETVGEFPDPDPIEAIKFKLDQMGLKQKDLSKILGLKSRASELLTRKRSMSLEIIRKINKELGISAEILIKPYKTVD